MILSDGPEKNLEKGANTILILSGSPPLSNRTPKRSKTLSVLPLKAGISLP